jgi:capsular polysaccharide biosynthesis protein
MIHGIAPKKRLIILSAVVVTGFLVSWTSPLLAQAGAATNPKPGYDAQVLLRVAHETPKILSDSSSQTSSFQSFKATQADLIRSVYVLNVVLKNPKIAKHPLVQKEAANPIGWLQSKLQVAYPGDTELMTIHVSHEDKTLAIDIANAVAKSYMETVLEEDHQATIRRLETLKKMYDRYQEDLRTKRTSLRTLSNTVGSDDRQTLHLRQSGAIETLQANERDLRRIRLEMVATETKLRLAQKDKEASKALLSDLQTTLAVQKAQAEFLARQIDIERVEITKLNVTPIDLTTEREDMALLTWTAQKIGREVETLEVELGAPKRVTLLSIAQ